MGCRVRHAPFRLQLGEPVETKILVAMSSNAETTRLLLRRGSSIAGRLNTNWFAVYVRTSRESPQRMSAREHRTLSENVTLAMELGAKVVWLSGENVAHELQRFAEGHGVTLAIFGKSRRPSPGLARESTSTRWKPTSPFSRLPRLPSRSERARQEAFRCFSFLDSSTRMGSTIACKPANCSRRWIPKAVSLWRSR